MESLKMKPWAKGLGLLGLAALAGGGLYYAISLTNPQWGLYALGAGLAVLIVAALGSLDFLRAFLSRRSARLGLSSGVSVLVVLALVVFLGALAARHHLRWDLSQAGAHTLAPQSAALVKDLKEPVKAYVFMRESQQGRQEAQELLEQYAYLSRLFTYQFVDPDRDPGLAKRFDIRTYGTVVLTQGEREERVKLPEEQGLTNALIRLSRAGKKTLYFLTGHGERGLADIGQEGISELKKAVEQQNYEIKTLILAAQEAAPVDAAALVAVGPKKAFSEHEAKLMGDYLGRGGGVMLLLDPQADAGLKTWLQDRGVGLGDDFIVDPQSRVFGASPAWPIVADFGDHDITRTLEGMICFFPLARSVEMLPQRPAGIIGLPLARTTQSAWGETDMKSLAEGQARFEEGKDHKGPLSLAVLATLPPAEKVGGAKDDKQPPQGRLLVVGNSSFLANPHLNQAATANRDLALNALSFLAEERDLIAIRPKETASQPLMISAGQAHLVFWVPVVLMPALFLVLGAAVWRRRRRPA